MLPICYVQCQVIINNRNIAFSHCSVLKIVRQLRNKLLFFSVYFAAKFLSQAILQNALQLSIVSSQIVANNLNFCVPIVFPVPNITILCLLTLPTCAYWKRYLPSLARNLTVIELFVTFYMRTKVS